MHIYEGPWECRIPDKTALKEPKRKKLNTETLLEPYMELL